HLPACADDSYGDLAPVRDQDFLQREVSTGPPMIPVFRDLMTLRARPEISVLLCSGRRGARPARREERAYRVYESDEQRSPAGCIGGQSGAVISGRALRAARRPLAGLKACATSGRRVSASSSPSAARSTDPPATDVSDSG